MQVQTSALKLLRADFKQGDEVFVVIDDGRFDWGTVHYDDQKVTLASGLRPARKYDWNKIVFMSHGGFPIRKIFGKFPEKEILVEDVPGLFRAALASENLDLMARKEDLIRGAMGMQEIFMEEISPGFNQAQEEMQAEVVPFEPLLTRIKFDDPFEIEVPYIRLFNAGNVGPQFYLHPDEEVLRMMARDGAKAHLWQLGNVFEFEISR